MSVEKFVVSGKEATLYPASADNRPLIVLNNYAGDGGSVMAALRQLDCPDFNLLCVGNLNWDDDMTPWACPPISANDAPCAGRADDYLNLLLAEILPKAKASVKGTPSRVSIAGYSLAGLFALYSMYRCDVFESVASMSGSLWFPGFKEYVLSHSVKRTPDKLYLSLGDKEAKTGNPYLKTVRKNTEEIAEHYKRLGIGVTWELNPGNHFKDAALRSAKGILAIL